MIHLHYYSLDLPIVLKCVPNNTINPYKHYKKTNTNNSNYKIIFVTLDPLKDTQKSLASYIESFDDNIIGLTGEISEIDKFAKKWNVYWGKVAYGKDDYTINHTATVFMLNKKGDFAGTISWGEDENSIEIKLNKLFSS